MKKKQKGQKETTKRDLMEALDKLCYIFDRGFNRIEQRFEKIKRCTKNTKNQFNQIDQNFNTILDTVITKDYLDKKMSEFRAELTRLTGVKLPGTKKEGQQT